MRVRVHYTGFYDLEVDDNNENIVDELQSKDLDPDEFCNELELPVYPNDDQSKILLIEKIEDDSPHNTVFEKEDFAISNLKELD